MKLKIPYLRWRGGRPRWVPGPHLLQRGFKGQDLKDDQGQWMGMGDAVVAAEILNARAKIRTPAKSQKPKATGPLLSHVWANYTMTPEFRGMKPATQYDYTNRAKIFLAWAGDAPVAQLKRKTIKAFWRKMYNTRGHTMANHVIATLRRTLSFALEDELILVNPASALRLKSVPPRVVIWTPNECELLLATADKMGEYGIGDAIVLALHTAQRRGDILTMPPRTISDKTVRLKQSKTNAVVEFPATSILQERMRLAFSRNSKRKITWDNIIIDDHTTAPFNSSTFGHRFAKVRAKAAEYWMQDQDNNHAPMLDKKFLDFRDTALTRLYLAKLTVPRIASISGHDIAHVDKVLRHYIALNADDGREAIEAYEIWMTEQGVKV